MLKTGILNPQINSLLSRFRHTNTIVIADRGFPSWPTVETIDITLIDDVPKVLDVLRAVCQETILGKAWMAQEFVDSNDPKIVDSFGEVLEGISFTHEQHDQFKLRIPNAIGLIRTGDTIPYANMILESA